MLPCAGGLCGRHGRHDAAAARRGRATAAGRNLYIYLGGDSGTLHHWLPGCIAAMLAAGCAGGRQRAAVRAFAAGALAGNAAADFVRYSDCFQFAACSELVVNVLETQRVLQRCAADAVVEHHHILPPSASMSVARTPPCTCARRARERTTGRARRRHRWHVAQPVAVDHVPAALTRAARSACIRATQTSWRRGTPPPPAQALPPPARGAGCP